MGNAFKDFFLIVNPWLDNEEKKPLKTLPIYSSKWCIVLQAEAYNSCNVDLIYLFVYWKFMKFISIFLAYMCNPLNIFKNTLGPFVILCLWKVWYYKEITSILQKNPLSVIIN